MIGESLILVACFGNAGTRVIVAEHDRGAVVASAGLRYFAGIDGAFAECPKREGFAGDDSVLRIKEDHDELFAFFLRQQQREVISDNGG